MRCGARPLCDCHSVLAAGPRTVTTRRITCTACLVTAHVLLGKLHLFALQSRALSTSNGCRMAVVLGLKRGRTPQKCTSLVSRSHPAAALLATALLWPMLTTLMHRPHLAAALLALSLTRGPINRRRTYHNIIGHGSGLNRVTYTCTLGSTSTVIVVLSPVPPSRGQSRSLVSCTGLGTP